MKKLSTLILAIVVLFVWTDGKGANLLQSYQVQHQIPSFVERNSTFELSFKVPGISAKDVEEAYLFYRPEGDMAYSQKEASLVSSTFNVPLSVNDKQATSLEYYFQIQLSNGETITYPQNKAAEDPVRVDIVDNRQTEREKRVEETGVDYTILSPEPGSTVSQQDVVIAITLFYEPAEIDTANSSFRMSVDGEDITEQAQMDNYFYTYAPDDLSSGTHTVLFELQKSDTVLTVTDWQFTVRDSKTSGGMMTSAEDQGRDSWMPEGNVQISARNQQVGGNRNDALRGNVRLSGQQGNISYSAHGLLTTQEDPRLQPQNRFGATLYVGDWLDLEAGHVYPNLSTMTISGQRMQGLNTGFRAWDEALNVQFVYGKLRRGIDNRYTSINVEEQTFEGAQEPVRNYFLQTREDGRGTFKRDVIGGRLGTERSDNLNFGLSFLKVQDDTNSIQLVSGFEDLMNTNPDLASSLNEQEMQELQDNPDQLNIRGNPTPKGNFVASTDLEAHFDNDRIQLQTDAAVSLLNQDISEGVLNQEAAEDLGFTIDQDTENILDRLSWLIIVNENMEVLPLQYDTETADAPAETFFPTSILAAQSELGLSYMNNNFQFRYRWVGPGYNSLANTTIRKDVAGFTIADRVQLYGNRIYLTLRYERLKDNVMDTKDATTHTNTYRTNISWYPINQDFPRVSLGLMMRNRDNEIGLNNPFVADISGVPEDAAIQNLSVQEGDTLITPNPKLSDTYQVTTSISQEFSLLGITHDASLNYSLINTKNRVFQYGDSQNNSFSFRVTNRYQDLPLQTRFGFNINNTETTSGLTDIQILGANIGGELFLLEDKLSLDMALAFTQNRSEITSLVTDDNNTPREPSDDYYKPASGDDAVSVTESNSFIIDTGAQYNLNARHSFLFDFRYSNVQNTLSTSRVMPNDHLLQVRYVYNF